jgi:hypothetical protein
MSQVISVRVPDHYEEACAAFQNEVNLVDVVDLIESTGKKFIVSYDKSAYKIECQGDIPDSVFSALVMVKDQFNGKLYYEGEEWNVNNVEAIEEAGSLEKIWIILAIIFFPITLVYLLIRVVIWVPYKVWKATK